jgi:thiosulfate/3-mercaptopyruvate sulfurtransferase
MNQDDKTMLPPDTLAAKFASVGAGQDRTVVFSCGSGVTACIMALAYDSLGNDRWSVYDGSWDEWGRWDAAPVETDAVTPTPR